MASKLKIRKLMLLLASTAMAGAAHSAAQAQGNVDCDSVLTKIAIASQEGSEGGVQPRFAHCVAGGQQSLLPEELVGTGEREARPEPLMTAEEKVNCDSPLAKIAIANQQGTGTGSIDPRYAHCVPGTLSVTPAFEGTAERETRLRGWEHAWPDQSYVQD